MTTPPTPSPTSPPEPGAAGAEPAPLREDKAEELRAFNTREQDSAWRAVAYLLTGPLVYGGLGALARPLAGHDPGSSGSGSWAGWPCRST